MVEIAREYAPGVCNISKEEESLRRASGWIGAALTVAAAVAFVALGVPPAWRLTLFFPAALSASGFLQAGLHFCAGYAMKGVFNVGAPVGTTTTVEQADALKKDRAKARLIFGLAALIGAVVAAIGYFVS
jgi:hypothetical protein